MNRKGSKLLEVSTEAYLTLESNVLALALLVGMMLEGNPEIQKKLKENGARVYTYKGENGL